MFDFPAIIPWTPSVNFCQKKTVNSRFNASYSLFYLPGNHNHTATQWILLSSSLHNRQKLKFNLQPTVLYNFTEICFDIGCLEYTINFNIEMISWAAVRLPTCWQNNLSHNGFLMNTFQLRWPICSLFHGVSLHCVLCSLCFYCLDSPWENAWRQLSTPAMLSPSVLWPWEEEEQHASRPFSEPIAGSWCCDSTTGRAQPLSLLPVQLGASLLWLSSSALAWPTQTSLSSFALLMAQLSPR